MFVKLTGERKRVWYRNLLVNAYATIVLLTICLLLVIYIDNKETILFKTGVILLLADVVFTIGFNIYIAVKGQYYFWLLEKERQHQRDISVPHKIDLEKPETFLKSKANDNQTRQT